jgi:hypothetical protein
MQRIRGRSARNKVYEFELDGKLVWEVNAQQPFSAARLPKGNTLIGTQTWPPKLIEVDKAGKTVWEHQPVSQPGRVRPRWPTSNPCSRDGWP